MKEVDIGTSKTRNLTRNRRLRVIIAASDEQKGLTRDSAEFGLSGRLRDENPDARRRISVRMLVKIESGLIEAIVKVASCGYAAQVASNLCHPNKDFTCSHALRGNVNTGCSASQALI